MTAGESRRRIRKAFRLLEEAHGEILKVVRDGDEAGYTWNDRLPRVEADVVSAIGSLTFMLAVKRKP